MSQAVTERATLTEEELAARWNCAVRTVRNARWRGEGPKAIRPMGRVVYRLVDIEAFEAEEAAR